MSGLNRDGTTESHDDKSAMRQIFEWHENETITEEQIQRVLAPVLEMIRQGKFSKRRRMRRIRKIAVGAATCITIVAVVVLQSVAPDAWAGVDIVDAQTPLAAAPFVVGSVSGKVTLEGEGVGGVVLTLVNTGSDDFIKTVTGRGGGYSFKEIPEGSYHLEVEPPDGTAPEDGADSFLLAVTGGEDMKGMEIRLCTAKSQNTG
jgi:hypothetical protein